MEKTLVLIKPDGVGRKLVGEILSRFERSGLKIEALKMVIPPRDLLEKHYPTTDEWFSKVGRKVLDLYKKQKIDPKAELGSSNLLKIGKLVKKWTVDYLASGPVIAMILSGYHAVENTRKLCGYTYPFTADVGSIRGDFCLDSPLYANIEKRAVKNLVHASESHSEAGREIDLWFPEFKI